MGIVRDCVAASELNTAVPIDPPACWAVLTIADATSASWDLTPLVAAFCPGPKFSPGSEAGDHAGFRVIGRVARLSGSSRAGIPGGYGSDLQNFAELE